MNTIRTHTIRTQTTPPAAAHAARAQRGFSFMEVVIVMGAMAMLAALAVGVIGNMGKSTYIAQAKGMLSETAYRCISASIGEGKAEFTLRRVDDEDGYSVLRIGAIVSRPVLTHQFETLEFASGGNVPKVNGTVEISRTSGRTGNCAHFKGGHLAFPAQSRFAMTEGLEVDAWVRPEAGGRVMSVCKAGDSYEVMLVQRGESPSYDVRLRMKLRDIREDDESTPLDVPFLTSGGSSGPVVADGRWNRIQVVFHGLEPSIRVNGLECYHGEEGATTGRSGARRGAMEGDELEGVRRIAVPRTGALPLTISSVERPFQGEIDGFHIMGVFRSEELERDLPGDLEVIYPTLPLRIAFANGALDPDIHNSDLMVRLRDRAQPDDPPLRLTLGMYGKVAAFIESPGEGGPDATNPRMREKTEDGPDTDPEAPK